MPRPAQPAYMLRWPAPDTPRYSHFLLWPPELRMEYEERAAVYEFDGMLSRQDAENRAFAAARALFDEMLATQPNYPPRLNQYAFDAANDQRYR